jgi:hypothetical protein
VALIFIFMRLEILRFSCTFDSWFFMQKQTPINKEIVEARMEMALADYIQKCIDHLESMSDRGILNGLGELIDENIKKFVRTKLRTETISRLRFYKEFPIITASLSL